MATATDADGGVTTYGYDLDGNRTTMVDAAGRTTTATYDAAGELSTLAYSDTATPGASYSYDADGQRTSMTDGTGTTTWAYDALGRLTSSKDGSGAKVSYGYDPAGNETSITYPGNHQVTRSYDTAGRVESVTDWLGNTTSFTNDADGQVTATGYPAATGETDTTTFDAAGTPTATSFGQGGSSLASFDYTSDGAGRFTGIDPTGITGDSAHTYGFDVNGWLTSDNTTSYGYDSTGRVTTMGADTQVYDPAGRLCWTAASPATGGCTQAPAGATTYGFNSVGERTSTTVPGGSTTAYSWDQAGNLTGVSSSPSSSIDGRYTPAGSPQVVLDTRAASLAGSCTPSPCATLTAGSPVAVQVAGTGTVPATGVEAVVARVAVVNPQAAGTVTVWPDGASQPSGTSVSFDGSELVATRQVLLAVGTDGKVKVAADTGVDVTVSVIGWITSDTAAGGYVPAGGPVQILSTVPGSIVGTCSPSPCRSLQANAPVGVQVAGVGAVPATGVSAVAVAVSVTDARLTGSVTLWASGAAEPAGGSLAFARGEDVDATLVVPVGTDGKIDVAAGGIGGFGSTVDVDARVVGWFAPGGGQPVSVVGPVEVADTATGQGACVPGPCAALPAGGSETIGVAGVGGLPAAGVGAVWLEVTATPTGTGTGVVSVVDGGGEVPVAVLDGAGVVKGGVLVPIGADGTVTVSSTAGTDVNVVVAGTVAAPDESAAYGVDGTGLRVSDSVDGGPAGQLVWDRSGSVPALLGDGSDWFVYGPTGPVEQIDAATSTPTWLHTDATGSVRMLTDTSGAVAGTATWDGWGNPVSVVGQTSVLGYRGAYRDSTGLDYLWHRVYDPATGQFLSVDPAQALTGQPYGYGGNNPINNTDPTGLFWGQGVIGNLVGSFECGWQNFTAGLHVLANDPLGSIEQLGSIAYRNLPTIVTVAAIAACLTVGPLGCVIASELASGVRVAFDIANRQPGGPIAPIVLDPVVTSLTLGLVGIPAAVGEESTSVLWQRIIIRLSASSSDILRELFAPGQG